MNRSHRIIVIVVVSIVLVLCVTLFALWKTGHLCPKDNNEDLREHGDANVEGEVSVDDVREKNSDTNTEQLEDDVLALWLSDDNRDRQTQTVTYDDVSTVVVSSDWKCQRRSIPTPDGVSVGDLFGYAMDASSGVACVSAPGHRLGGTVYVYMGEGLRLVQVLDAPTTDGDAPPLRFGNSVTLSETAAYLVVQADSSTFVYRMNDDKQAYVLDHVMPKVQRDCQVLGASPDGTLWINHHVRGIMELVERGADGVWSTSLEVPGMAMDVSYEPLSQHVWIATADGLQHWSKNPDGAWAENAMWMKGVALTTVEQFSPAEGVDLLVVGEAHRDLATLVSALNPHQVVDRLGVPGGGDENVLFCERALWWPHAAQMLITAPMDGYGSVTAYSLSSDSVLLPTCMMRADRQAPRSSGQFGSHAKMLDERTVLVTESGTATSIGGVTVITQ